MALLSAVATRVPAARNLDAILAAVGDELVPLGLSFAVGRLQGEAYQLLRVCNPPEIRSAVEALAGKGLEGASGPLDPAVRAEWMQRRPVFTDSLFVQTLRYFDKDAKDGAAVRDAFERLGHGPMLLAPLWVGGALWGGLALCGRHLREADAPAVMLFAAHLAAAIEVAETIGDLERRNRQLETIRRISSVSAIAPTQCLVPELLQIAAEATGSDRAAIYLIEPDRTAMTLLGQPHGYAGPLCEKYRRIPLTGTATGSAAMNLEPRAFQVATEWPVATRADLLADGFRQAALVPLVVQGRAAGTLNLARTSDRPYTAEDLAAVQMLGEHIGNKVEKNRLQADLERRVRELSALHAVGVRLAEQNLDLQRSLEAAIEQVRSICQVENAFVMLVTPDGSSLRMAASNRGLEAADLVLPLDGPSTAAEAVRVLGPVRIDDAQTDPRADAPSAKRYGHKALLGIPLVASGRAIGAVVLGDTQSTRRFTEDDVRLVTAVANQLASAIANAQLYEDLRRSYARLERTQSELVTRERLAALGELAALVAHEVRNPLAVIFNSLASLNRLLSAAGGDVAVLLKIVDEEANRLDQLVRDFLEFARPNEPAIQPEPVEPVVMAALEAARGECSDSTASIVLDLAPGLPELPMDARLMRQALVNLFTNALQSMPKGGELRVRTRLAGLDGRDEVSLEVADQGSGIPQTVRERLFQPFVTTKATGTGLGLAVVKRIVDAHHGRVEVATAAGRGTTFTIRLPMERPASG